MARTVFRNAALLDGLNPPRKADIVVEDERIALICPPGGAPSETDDTIYDLDGLTLMPGLVSGHSHLSYLGLDARTIMDADMKYPGTYMAVATVRNAETVLRAGFTTAIGAGGVHNLDAVLKQLMEDGLARGPRLVAGGLDFVPTGNPIDYRPEWWNTGRSFMGAICDGPDEWRKAVRQECKRGVEIIKIYPGGGHGIPRLAARMTYEEIAVTVETAHLCNMRVRAHAASRESIKLCLQAGVDIIDHGDMMDEELIELFIRNGTYVLPSLCFPKMSIGMLNTKEDCETWYGHARTSIALGIKAGVKFVTGDDFGLAQMPHGLNAQELPIYAEEIGVSPLEVIKWATHNGGEMSGIEGVGQIAQGYLADILVVDGDPATDLRCLSDPAKLSMVMQNGKVITSSLAAAPGAARVERRELADALSA